MSEQSDIKAAIQAGTDIAQAQDRIVDVAGIPYAIVPDGFKVTPLEKSIELSDARAPSPRRCKGIAAFTELSGFVEHVNRFKQAGAVVFANTTTVNLTAILNYSGSDDAPAWGDHRAFYACPLSEQWKFWIKSHETIFTQDQFGELLEQRAADLADNAAKLLEVARNLIIRTKGDFERRVDPSTGEFSFVNKVENDVSSTKIPKLFVLGIPVFEAGEPWRLEARLRFAMRDHKPVFSYSLVDANAALRSAFGEVRDKVNDLTKLPVWAGAPE